MLDVAVDHPDGGDHRLARIGRLERELAGDPQAGHGQRFLDALSEGGGGAGVGVVELERERGELLERAGVVGLAARPRRWRSRSSRPTGRARVSGSGW